MHVNATPHQGKIHCWSKTSFILKPISPVFMPPGGCFSPFTKISKIANDRKEHQKFDLTRDMIYDTRSKYKKMIVCPPT